jgi:hypothetical protein
MRRCPRLIATFREQAFLWPACNVVRDLAPDLFATHFRHYAFYQFYKWPGSSSSDAIPIQDSSFKENALMMRQAEPIATRRPIELSKTPAGMLLLHKEWPGTQPDPLGQGLIVALPALDSLACGVGSSVALCRLYPSTLVLRHGPPPSLVGERCSGLLCSAPSISWRKLSLLLRYALTPA